MNRKRIITRLTAPALLALAILPSCGGKPLQSRCDVEVYTPNPQYSEVVLLDDHGNVLDSTLTVRNDSVIFSRTDSLNMPYVATLRLRNPNEKLDALYMPIVIEGGTVKLELTNAKVDLTGTSDNIKLIKFVRAKNKFLSEVHNAGYTPEQQREELSHFFTLQAVENKDNVLGHYIFDTYSEFLIPEDMMTVREAIGEK